MVFWKGISLAFKKVFKKSYLKLYLNLDINEVESRLKCKDVSDRNCYKEVPVLLRIKSERAMRNAKYLIDIVAKKHSPEIRRPGSGKLKKDFGYIHSADRYCSACGHTDCPVGSASVPENDAGSRRADPQRNPLFPDYHGRFRSSLLL